MSNYDFATLNDKEFEALTIHLLSNELDARLERFKPGRDAGVDGRYFSAPGHEIIVQCKHWARTPLASLLRSLEKDELPKVRQLNPVRYILVTSIELSRRDKERITKLFTPYIHSASDVFGREDINDLLAKYPQVEKDHYKLWLASTSVLDQLLHAAIYGRSTFLLADVARKASRYVRTNSHALAERKLKDLGVVLITGEPGIGKTTLAEQLCLMYATRNFEVAVLSHSIEEAEEIFRPDVKQIFYFDDFLGTNYLAALERHEDSRIVNFIKRVASDRTKRFILTSRTTILNQGKSLSDRFKLGKVERNELELKIESLSEMDKARILYNHLWFSDLPVSYVEQLSRYGEYRRIIKHPNFNPRLIEFITDAQRNEGTSSSDYVTHIHAVLKNPRDVWQHVFEGQLDDYNRLLVCFVVANGAGVLESDLRAAYEAFIGSPRGTTYSGVSAFDRNLRIVVGSVLNRSLGAEGSVVSLFNPSIADYVIPAIRQDYPMLEALFVCLRTLRSIANLSELISNQIVPTSDSIRIVVTLVRKSLNDPQLDLNYRARLAELATETALSDTHVQTELSEFIVSINDLPASFDSAGALASCLSAVLHKRILPPAEIAALAMRLASQSLNFDDLTPLAQLKTALGPDIGSQYEIALIPSVIDCWKGFVEEEVEGSGVCAKFGLSNWRDAQSKAYETVETFLGEYGLAFSDDDIQQLAEEIDVRGIIERQGAESDRDYYDDREGGGSFTQMDEIDDLFRSDFPPR